jgi:chemotaxis protein histidine kinase CheA/CheY-like chemotaxis protein
MQSEQQQRIMGYFIEEAKDHLNTIEQGLLSLQSTMEDREMLNEIFRAAHSVKGGAAMLGINSIQQTAHRLEDCFKVLQESPVKVDHHLESLFLRVFDTLQALVEQLQSSFGLTDETASEIMSDAEPVFEELNAHLETLVKKAEGASVATVAAPKVALANAQMNTGNTKTLPVNFKRDVLIELREMLQRFKQQDSPEHREALQEHCRNLARLGEQMDLPGWGELLDTARVAIASSANAYRLLANVVIKEIKQAQELVVTGRSVEICASDQLRALAPDLPASETTLSSNALHSDIDLMFDEPVEQPADELETVQAHSNLLQDESESSLTDLGLFDGSVRDDDVDLEDFISDTIPDSSAHQTHLPAEQAKTRRIYRFAAPSEPEVGMAELNTLADIFEGQTPDLDETWQEEEIISLDDTHSTTISTSSVSVDDHSDFSDLVGDLDGFNSKSGDSSSDDLMDLLGDPSLEEIIPSDRESIDSISSALSVETPITTTNNVEDDFADLLFEADSPDPLFSSSGTSDDLSSLFGDSFFKENSPLEEDLDDFDLDTDTTSQLQQQDEDLFAMPSVDVFDETPEMFSTTKDGSRQDEDSLSESFTTQDHEFLAFDISSEELENLDADENWLDSDSTAESEMDFGDLLEISDSPTAVTPQEPGWSDEQVLNDQATHLGIEELALDEPAAAFDFDAHADWIESTPEDGTTAESPSTELSLDESFFETPTNDISYTERFSDLGLEDFMSSTEASSTDAWNWDEESEISLDESGDFNLGEEYLDESGDFNLGEEYTDTAAADQMPEQAGELDDAETVADLSSLAAVGIEESVVDLPESELTFDDFAASELDFDLDATSTSSFNFEVDSFEADSSGDIENLFADEAFTASDASQDAALEDLEVFADLLEAPTTEAETEHSDGLDLSAFAQPEASFELGEFDAETEHSDELDLSAFAQPEASFELGEFDAEAEHSDELDLSAFAQPEASFELGEFDAETEHSDELDLSAFAQPEASFELGEFDAETEHSDGLDLSAFAQPEASFELDTFDDFFTTEEASEIDTAGVETVAGSNVDSTLNFEDFLLFDAPATTDNQEITSLSALQEEGFEELIFESSTPEAEPVADVSNSLFDDTDEGGFFDLEALEGSSADSENADSESAMPSAVLYPSGSPREYENLYYSRTAAPNGEGEATIASDFDELFGNETPEETDSLDFSSFSSDDLLFETDLFAEDSSAPELVFETGEDTTAEAQALLFEEYEIEDATLDGLDVLTPELATESAAVVSSSASDLEELFSDVADTEYPHVSDENLFETDLAASEEQTLSDEAAATNLFDVDWEDTGAVEVDNLDNFLSTETDEVTDAQNWDELLNLTLDVEAPSVDTPAFSEALDDEAAVFELDWDTEESSNLLAQSPEESVTSASAALEFDDLEAMLTGGQDLNLQSSQTASGINELESQDEFADLEAMLAETAPAAAAASDDLDVFKDLDALLEEETPATTQPTPSVAKRGGTLEDEFGDLESLLKDAETKMGGSPTVMPDQGRTRPLIRPRPTRVFEHTMRVPVKHLDSLSNLVGELVVNRNTLEQDQERLRQFLDNLSHQVLALSDVGARMQDLYERSLLESSLLASRQSHRSSGHSDGSSHHPFGVEYDPLEMDRFTGFHLLSQEMIELIVRVRESASDIEFLVDETDQVARMLRQITTQLQEGLTRARMVPFAQNADRLLRAVHEISRKLGKEAQLHVEGRETLIDKMILEHLYDPMTHLVNNALTHGVELPSIRKAAGKPRVGKVTLRAFHQGNQTVIAISDDGAGIDPERVRAKAIEQKLISAAEAKKLTNIELYDFLFHPGFSTKDKADDFSGRGVGMDVVRTSLSEIRGTIHIDSAVGKGTTFTIRLPLTLSICKALCCLSDRASIAFPMDGVEDAFDLPADRVQNNSDGHKCIPWRDGLLPFQPLADLLTYKRQLSRNAVYGGKREDDMISIIVLRSAGNFLAIQVDKVLGEQEIVIKQLEGPPPKPVGIAGATVLGDGRIMAIADVLELIDLANGRIRKDSIVTMWPREEPEEESAQELLDVKSEPLVLIVDDSITVRELLSMTFSKSGYRVEQARDGQEAWEKLRSGLPCDIVFCDIEMPRMDGLELLSRLQKDDKLCHLPIAMLTSRGADRHRQMASQLGASGYFTKPYLEEVLLDAAQRMIRGEVLFSSSSNA